MTEITETPLAQIKPYARNPRNNDRAVQAVMDSIQAYGFLQPIVVDRDGVIIVGHTRYKAAKKLGLKTAPVIRAANLTPEQAKAYRLVDNKAGELAGWSTPDLVKEIQALEATAWDAMAWGFEPSTDMRLHAAWKTQERRCDCRQEIKIRSQGGRWYISLFRTTKTGDTLQDIKQRADNAGLFAECLADFLRRFCGRQLEAGDFCLVTAPRRRHKELHFATEVCRRAASELRLPFYADAITVQNKMRIDQQAELQTEPAEKNVVFFDDIIASGATLQACSATLERAGYNVLAIIGVKIL